jgi:signal transduction histidine kinase
MVWTRVSLRDRQGLRFRARLRALACVLLISGACGACAGASAGEVFLVSPATVRAPLAPHLEILRDPTGALTLPEARAAYAAGRFTRNRQAWPSFGFTRDAIWVRCELQSRWLPPDNWLVLLRSARVDHVAWFLFQDGVLLADDAAGNLDPPATQRPAHRFPALRLTGRPGAPLELYVRVAGQASLNVPLVLWAVEDHARYAAVHGFGEALFFGYMLALVIIGALLAAYTHDRGFLIYALSVASFIVVCFILSGYYSWFDLPYAAFWNYSGALLWDEVALILALLFLREFFNLGRHYPRADRLVRWTVIVFTAALLPLATLPFRLSVQIVLLQALAVGTALLAASAVLSLRRVKIARFYALAWCAFWGMVFVEILQMQNLIPTRVPTGYGLQLGVVIGSTLFMLALADRVRQLRQGMLAAQQQALDLQRQMTAELERQVAERTRELAAAKRAAEQSSEAKSRFFSHVSHDLRAPLNSLVGLSQSLWLESRDLVLPEEFRQFLLQIQQSGAYLGQLMDNILNLAAVEAGKAEVRAQPFALHDWYDRIRAIVEPLARSQRVCASWVCDAPPGQMITGDAVKLSQILLNLALNAIKFTPPGKEVQVAVRLADDRLVVAVADAGPGIPAGERERIFEPFAQLAPSVFQATQGVGLGLAIVRYYVTLLGGDVRLSEVPGGGACFTCSVPLGRGQPGRDADATAGPQADAAPAPAQRPDAASSQGVAP